MKRKATREELQKKKQTAMRKVARTGDYQKGREMPRQPKTEIAAYDLAQVTQNFTVAGNFTALNVVINGTELYNRVKRKLYMKSVHIRGFITNIATAVQDMGRILLVYDGQTNANNPALALNQILQDMTGAAATTGTSHINLNNRARFKIIRDYQVTLPSVTNTAGVLTNFANQDNIKHSFNIPDMYVKLKGLETIFNATNGGTIADIQTGALLLVMLSNTASNQWAFTFGSRMRYYD